jgi:hypothetical protein
MNLYDDVLKILSCYTFLVLFHDNYYHVAYNICIVLRSLSNGVYQLNYRDSPGKYQVYCHMTEINGCEGKGWTLVMKMDGNKVTKKQFNIENNDKYTHILRPLSQ